MKEFQADQQSQQNRIEGNRSFSIQGIVPALSHRAPTDFLSDAVPQELWKEIALQTYPHLNHLNLSSV